MIRWIAALSTLLLAGCVTSREYVYRDGYYDNGQSDSRYYSQDDRYAGGSDGYYDQRYRDGGSYYAPAYSGRGDYYYSRPNVSQSYYSSYPSWYVDYPAYYSLFWGLNRSWYDPFSYPNYYYGVTYYPRNYFSISFNSGWGGSRYGHYGYQYYSPYRYSWVDNYYDWSPWHDHHSRNRYYQPTPRYGSARNEAERLSSMSDRNAYYGQNDGGSYYGQRDRGSSNPNRRETAFGTYGTARDGSRGADYGSRSAPRQDPGTRGFGVPTDGGGSDGYRDVRRNASYGTPGAPRQDPGTRGFGVPVEANGRGNAPRSASYDASQPRALPSARGFGVESPQSAPRNAMPAPSAYNRDARYGAQREVGRYGSDVQPRIEREPRQRGYDAGSSNAGVALPRQSDRGYAPRAASGYERGYERTPSAPVAREYSRPAMPARGYDAAPPADRGYRTPPRESYREAPSRGYAPAPEARSYSAPSRGYDAGASAPSYAAPPPAPAARYEARPEPRSEPRSESDSGDRGVRRVGNNRDD